MNDDLMAKLLLSGQEQFKNFIKNRVKADHEDLKIKGLVAKSK